LASFFTIIPDCPGVEQPDNDIKQIIKTYKRDKNDGHKTT